MPGKKLGSAPDPNDVWRAAMENMKELMGQVAPPFGRGLPEMNLPDPVYGPRDFDATKHAGEHIRADMPLLSLDPAKQLEYADRMGRAWLALRSGWMAPSAQKAELATGPHPFDVFLSHSKRDEARIRDLERDFEAEGLNVYVDWSDDPLLDRRHVDRETAARLQARMHQCKALVLALSAESAASPWVQWELGFFDALRGVIFILPLDAKAKKAVEKQEYFDLYPVIDPADAKTDFIRRYRAAVG